MSTEDLVWNQAQWESFFVDLCRFEQDKGTSLAQKFYNQGICPTHFNLLVESDERVVREELKQLDILTYGDYVTFVIAMRRYLDLSDKASSTKKTSWKRARIEEEADEAQKKPDPKDIEWFNSLKLYALYYEDENKTKHCITPITTRIAATYAHGSHSQLTIDRTNRSSMRTNRSSKKPIEVRCYYDKKYCVAAKVVLRSDGHDIVILQAISKNFIEKNPDVVLPQIGMRYLMLGLSNIEDVDEPFSLGIGSVKAIQSDVNRYIGSSGCSKGDSGAGIWNSDGNLIGMNILVKHNPVKMKESRQGTHQQYTHAIRGAAIFIPTGTIKAFASEYIPKAPPVEFEE